jgi:3-hydroxyacyl-CoA dehydrogenase/enoyl-CoA hydratase/3-hydroxybutyryl-CoA epimerase
MHYFSPVNKMPLLEVITTDRTDPRVVATAVAVGRRQGKTVIVVRDGFGFYTSRILGPYLNEAGHLLAEGVPIEDLDAALVEWGFPVGPVTLLDEVGIDVAAKAGKVLHEAFGDRLESPDMFVRLLDDGRTGRKGRKGFYRYDAHGTKVQGRDAVDASVYALLGLSPGRFVPPAEIAERCALQMVGEAIRCLDEGILRSARDGDVGAVFGLGFPPFRGGPFRFADALGARELLVRFRAYEQRLGPRWAPPARLVALAAAAVRPRAAGHDSAPQQHRAQRPRGRGRIENALGRAAIASAGPGDCQPASTITGCVSTTCATDDHRFLTRFES